MPAIVNACALLMIVSISTTAHSAKWKTIIIEGSSSISPFVQPIAAAFGREKQIGISISTNGSKIGYECAIKKACQIGMTSKTMSPEEAKDLLVTTLALDGVGVVVSRDVKIESMTGEQLRGVFSGVIKNWQELGGPNLKIDARQRRAQSSLRELFNQLVKTDPKLPEYGSNEEAFNRLRVAKGAISYVSLGQAIADQSKSVRILKLDGIEASIENLRNGKYNMKRVLYLVRNKDYNDDPVLDSLIQRLLNARQELFPKIGLVIP